MLNVCRLCLSSDANFLISNGQTALKIIACTAVEVQPNDDLPQVICPECLLRVEEHYAFRKRCHAADRRLRRNKVLQSRDPKGVLVDTLVAAEDEFELHDVAGCTPTACSESSAQWRMQTAQLIRTEIDSYKKQLLSACKQEVRAEIEQELRKEVEEKIEEEAKKKCRIGVLDDVFHEMERFFERKRNETLYGNVECCESYWSDSDNMRLRSITSSNQVMAFEGSELYVAEAPVMPDKVREDGNVSFVDLLDDDSNPKTPSTTAPEAVATPGPIVPVTMVEIPISDPELNNLREDFNTDTFLSFRSTAKKTTQVKPSPLKKVRSHRRKDRYILCRKHSQRYDPASEDPANCIRCRLRHGDRHSSTLSK
ncbi:uncharacterized protein LOC108157254 [Drosophila miranda]|uniref:uncharacterized protein LOC108157254 n=1 Tax=Drosophila miranda TaxID=7229 RepID=UPI0007E783ED|nr:uncharacterized protein LOC108157254 [Drosophila miranda]